MSIPSTPCAASDIPEDVGLQWEGTLQGVHVPFVQGNLTRCSASPASFACQCRESFLLARLHRFSAQLYVVLVTTCFFLPWSVFPDFFGACFIYLFIFCIWASQQSVAVWLSSWAGWHMWFALNVFFIRVYVYMVLQTVIVKILLHCQHSAKWSDAICTFQSYVFFIFCSSDTYHVLTFLLPLVNFFFSDFALGVSLFKVTLDH